MYQAVQAWQWGGLSLGVAMNLMAAILFGGIVGLERSARGRQAGARTYAIVSLAAACALCAIGQEASAQSLGDPASRVIQGLLTGLGFLGAGVIMRDGLQVKGLTTAASIWLTSAIGIMCGLGLIGLAAFATACALGILAGLKALESAIPKDHYAQIDIKLPAETAMGEREVKAILRSEGFRPVELAFRRDAKKRVEFEISAVYSKRDSPSRLAQRLIAMNGHIEAFEISSSPDEPDLSAPEPSRIDGL
jgi:putative Mg2+ transporter-C (MgtC) family protein